MPSTTRHRGYQANFYAQSSNLHDLGARRAKAAKIVHCLDAQGALSLGQHAVALDLGCANGLVVEALEPFAPTLVGLDYDPDALQAAPEPMTHKATLIRGDAMTLPFGDETIDLVVCAQVYEHVPDDLRLVEEMRRVLKPGGIAFFSGPNWLFPIEPHYGLPFLHWLPSPIADRWLRALGRGEHYYERSRTTWGLCQLLSGFAIHDVTSEAMRYVFRQRAGVLAKILLHVPTWAWRLVTPLVPNVNWILTKPQATSPLE